jgi:pilus assembly protein CpaB
MQNWPRLIFAVAVGLLATFFVAMYIKRLELRSDDATTLKEVCVTTSDILANRAIDERALRRTQAPMRYVQPLAFSDCQQAVGRIAAIPVPAGTQLSAGALVDPSRVGLSTFVDPTQRALTVAVDSITGVGGWIRPRDIVDVFVAVTTLGSIAGQGPGRGSSFDERTEVSLRWQGLSVLAVGQEYEGVPAESAGSQGPESALEPLPRSTPPRLGEARHVTLLVTPEQAQGLILAQRIGHLTLALRSNLDATPVKLDSLSPRKLLGIEVPIKSRQETFGEYHGVSGSPFN